MSSRPTANSPTRAFARGNVSSGTWPVFGPAFPARRLRPWAARDRTLAFNIPVYSDSDPDHFGFSTSTTRRPLSTGGPRGRLDLRPARGLPYGAHRPGRDRDLPAETSATRGVSASPPASPAAWTFAPPPVGEQPLPLTAIRFARESTPQPAPRRTVLLPVWVQRQPGASTPRSPDSPCRFLRRRTDLQQAPGHRSGDGERPPDAPRHPHSCP